MLIHKILVRAAEQCCATVYNFTFSLAMNSRREELPLWHLHRKEKSKLLNITQKK